MILLTGVLVGLIIGDTFCWIISGEQRYKKPAYAILPWGGYMAALDKIKTIDKQ